MKHDLLHALAVITSAVGVSLTCYAQCDPLELQQILASDGQAGDGFGYAVDMSGPMVIVGAPFDDETAGNSGAAFIFERDGAGVWHQAAKLIPSDWGSNGHFGLDVAIEGDTAIISKEGDTENGGTSAGAAYIFRRQMDGTWEEVTKLLASDGDRGDHFGAFVSISGDTVLVGAYLNGDAGPNSGSAYIFRENEAGEWPEVQKLTASDAEAQDLFGLPVLVDSGVAFIGATRDDDQGTDSGSVYVFVENEAGVWEEVQKLTATDGEPGDDFGFGLALSENKLVIGARLDDELAPNSGSAYVFQVDGAGEWSETAKLTPAAGSENDLFGWRVAIWEDHILVGALLDDFGGQNGGAGYLFSSDQMGGWTESAIIVPGDIEPGDNFCHSVALVENVAIFGARRQDDNGVDSGSAYFYDLNCESEAVSALLTDFAVIDGTLISGGLPELESSDNMYVETEAKVTGEAAETHRMRMLIGATTTVQSPGSMDITLEAHITDIEAIVTIFLRNWNNGNMEQVGQFTNGFGNDTTNTVNVPNASRFVRNDGRIELLLKKIVILPFTLNGFHSLEDLLEIRVR